MGYGTGISRRELLRDAAAIGATATLLGPGRALAAGPRRKPTVAVLGGGMAGLAVAHELIERGFAVRVFERKALGGKARSIPVAGTGAGGRADLPGEHGFRFFPGFYHHVPDSMRRTPEGGNPNGVWDNLVATSATRLSRAGGPDIIAGGSSDERGLDPGGVAETVVSALNLGSRIPPNELAEFVQRLMVFLTSCDERRYGQWEYVPWLEFVRAEGKSKEYNDVIARGLTRTLVAAKEQVASARTICNMGEAFVMTAMNRGNDGEADRLLDAPTNEAWIDPWVKLLRTRGVKFHLGQTVTSLQVRRGRIEGARVVDRRGRRRTVEADWYVVSMPAEAARRLWSAAVLRADPSLEQMKELQVDWMNGIQYYLRRPVPITQGHVAYMDAPWALTSISQAQFWRERDFPARYGDGHAKDCLSVDVSDWDTPGLLTGRPAKQCTREEIGREVWHQLKLHLNDEEEILRDDDVLSFFLDPAIQWRPAKRRNANDEPLLVNTVGSWEKRPRARTEIPNMFLAGDYVQTDIDLATMEGANESGRAAANALLESAGSRADPAAMYKLYDPPEFEAAKRADLERWKAGQPNAFDAEPPDVPLPRAALR